MRLVFSDSYFAGSVEHLLDKAAQAARKPECIDVMSRGEALGVALVLNRHDILTKMGYTIVEAIGRIGPVWAAALPDVEETLAAEGLLSRAES